MKREKQPQTPKIKKPKRKVDFKLHNIIITFIVLLMVLFAIMIDFTGYGFFTSAIINTETDYTYRTAEIVATIVDADKIDEYIASHGESDEYRAIKNKLTELCTIQDFTHIIIIKTGTDEAENIVVFDIMNQDNLPPLELGENVDGSKQDEYQDFVKGFNDRRTVVSDNIFDDENANISSTISLKNADGETVALITVEKDVNELSFVRGLYIIVVSVITVVLLVISILVARFFVKRNIVKPLNAILTEAETFANDSVKNKNHNENQTNHISMVKELNGLANSIDKMEDDTIQYIDNLTAATKENERIGTELKLAREIQQSVLPSTFPAFPGRKDFDIYATMNAAKEIGGDFYDFFLIDDDHLAMAIADVSGKGIPAALFMMNVKILINEYALLEKTPADILTAVNKRICQNNKNVMFVTVWLGILELSTGNLVYANAGHEDPAIGKKGVSFSLHQTKHDLVLGAKAGYQYQDYSLKLKQGDKIFLYTDGVTDATKDDKTMYGSERMITTLNKHQKQLPETILKNLAQDINDFAGAAQQFDDITMLCLEYKGSGRHAKKL